MNDLCHIADSMKKPVRATALGLCFFKYLAARDFSNGYHQYVLMLVQCWYYIVGPIQSCKKQSASKCYLDLNVLLKWKNDASNKIAPNIKHWKTHIGHHQRLWNGGSWSQNIIMENVVSILAWWCIDTVAEGCKGHTVYGIHSTSQEEGHYSRLK